MSAREAGGSIKPGVERSETPGYDLNLRFNQPAKRGGSFQPIGVNGSHRRAVARFTGSTIHSHFFPGVSLRFTPGFMLSPAPQAGLGFLGEF